ncbi:MAG: FAD-binding oxidoreductase [Desulfomonile tiedjei]|nr:FAD-binding oxidoreductase [Desulfomonile tiedjei]
MKHEDAFYPDWTGEPPKDRTYRSIFKWGDPQGFKHPNVRLYRLLKEKLNMTDGDFTHKTNTGDEEVRVSRPVILSSSQIEIFRDLVGEENVDQDDFARARFALGKTTEEAMMLREGEVGPVADLVVHPRDKHDVMRVVEYCNQQRIPVYVYGGGSSVTLGLRPTRGGITLVMSTHMNRVLDFNETNQTITVEPGIMGPEYEKALNNAPELFKARRRYTGGHFPQSFEYSTVGGWIVTLGSGQESSYYGDACDLVVSQEYVTPVGTFKTADYPAAATGPKVNDIMKGSEGAFGVLVGATIRFFRRCPENYQNFGFMFPTWDAALDAAREISQAEFGLPAMFRVSDPEETEVALKLYGIDGSIVDRIMRYRGLEPSKRCLCIGRSVGERGFAKNVKRNVRRICRARGAMYLTGYPVSRWEHGRYTDPYMREDLNDYGVIIDTLETSVSWDAIRTVWGGVTAFLKSRPHTICMTHASHFYPQGTNLYFIFITRTKDLADYRKFHRAIIDRIEEHGGSLSHHHGVGKMMAPWMERHIGSVQMEVLRALKRHFDPNSIMNPGGTLGLDL